MSPETSLAESGGERQNVGAGMAGEALIATEKAVAEAVRRAEVQAVKNEEDRKRRLAQYLRDWDAAIIEAETRAREHELRQQKEKLEREKAERIAKEKTEAEGKTRREADRQHRKKVNNGVVYALQECGATQAAAQAFVVCVIKGHVPHVRIDY